MKKFFKMALFAAFLIAAFTATSGVFAESKELVKNPTFQDLEGTWEGTVHKDKSKGKDISTSATATFAFKKEGRMGLSIIRDNGGRTAFRDVSIQGSKIAASNELRAVTFKLYRKGSKRILEGEYNINSSGLTMSTQTLTGSYYFEYSGKK
jgi:hypothetical protein